MTSVAIALAYYRAYVSAWWLEFDHIVALRQKGGQVFTEPRGQGVKARLFSAGCRPRRLTLFGTLGNSL
jgi:hypothetical protein